MSSRNYDQDGIGPNFQLGIGGIRCRDNSTVFECRNAADSAYVSIRTLDVACVDITASGDVSLDSASPTLAMGDGLGSTAVVFDKLDGGTSRIDWLNEGIARWATELSSGETLKLARRFDASGVFQEDTVQVVPSDGRVQLAKELRVLGDVNLDSATPIQTIGDGTGSVGQNYDKGAASFTSVRFQVAGVNRWYAPQVDSAEDLTFERYNSSGVFQDEVKAQQLDGKWNFPSHLGVALDLNVDRNLDVDGLADFHDLVTISETDRAEINLQGGTGFATVRLFKAEASEAAVEIYSAGQPRWDWPRVVASEDLQIRRYNSSGVFQDQVLLQQADGNWVFPADIAAVDANFSGNLDLTGPNAILDMGDGTGFPRLIANKGAADEIQFPRYEADSVLRWAWHFFGSETLGLRRYNSSGVLQDTIFNINNTSGETDFGPAIWDMIHPGSTIRQGDGTGSPVHQMDKSAGGVAVWRLKDAGVTRWEPRLGATEDLEFLRYNSSGVFQDQVTFQQADGKMLLPTHLGVGIDLNVGANVSLTGASPSLTQGAGTGSPGQIFNKSDAGVATTEYKVAGVVRWQTQMDDVENFLVARRFNSSGVFQENSLSIPQSTGDIAVAKDLGVTGDLNMTGDIFGSGIDIGAVAGEIGAIHATATSVINGVRVGNGTALGGSYLSGTGAPGAFGTDGDLYLRTDGGSGTTLYQKRVGSWVGII